MKVTGGSFGSTGKIDIYKGGSVKIRSAQNRYYTNDLIESVSCHQNKGGGFSVGKGVLAIIILSIVLTPFLGLLGLVLGVAVPLLLMYQSGGQHTAELRFKDGSKVILDVDGAQADRLHRLPPN